jgi:biopolymer transport protein ExbD
LFFFLCAALIQSSTAIADLTGRGDNSEKYQTIIITKESISGLENLDTQPVLIKADADVDFGRVNGVLRVLQERGILRVNFAL